MNREQRTPKQYLEDKIRYWQEKLETTQDRRVCLRLRTELEIYKLEYERLYK